MYNIFRELSFYNILFMVVFIFITLSISCGNWGEELIYSNLVFVGIVMIGFFIFLFRKVVILGQ
jgi:hypothetical protein